MTSLHRYRPILTSVLPSHSNWQNQQKSAVSDEPSSLTESSYAPNSFHSRYPLYGLDWSYLGGTDNSNTAHLAVSSYREDRANRVEIWHGTASPDWIFQRAGYVTVDYPITRLQWDPQMALGTCEVDRLATTSECLRIYELANGSVVEKLQLVNPQSTSDLNRLPPLTSFDWNRVDPRMILTCSIDTTCTLWDVRRTTGVTCKQLIAHDTEVFDCKFISGSRHVFASCSEDASVRVFDLRSLENSTIVYEPESGHNVPLLRIAPSHYDANHLAVLEEDSSRILLLDLRYPGVTVAILDSHGAAVNSVDWHPSKNILLSGSDDGQALLWDMNSLESYRPHHHGMKNTMVGPIKPISRYGASAEINNVRWDPLGRWAALNVGKTTQTVKI